MSEKPTLLEGKITYEKGKPFHCDFIYELGDKTYNAIGDLEDEAALQELETLVEYVSENFEVTESE